MPYQRYKGSNWRLINLGCAVAAVVTVFVALLYTLVFLKVVGDKRFQRKMEQAGKLQQCKLNLQELGKAIGRYKEATGHYPQKLDDLLPLYLKKPDFIHCPNDPSPPQKISYRYIKPTSYDPDFVILICEHHPNPLVLHMNGRLEVVYRSKK